MLIWRHLQLKSRFAWSLSNLAAPLRQQLFIFRDWWAWVQEGRACPLESTGRHGWNRCFGQQRLAVAL